jgi:two-component system nitrogen regulation sensor histidine kinase NtrY
MSAASTTAAAADLRPDGKLSYLFGVGFTLAAATTAAAVWLASSGRPLQAVYAVLAVNVAVILGLAAMIAWRIRRLMQPGDVGAKLHLRFMSLFALAAAAPAVVVAFFFGVLVDRGIDSWFSDRIQTVVESHAMVAQDLVSFEERRLTQIIDPAFNSINGLLAEGRSPRQLESHLYELTNDLQFRSIHIVDRQGRILAKAEAAAPPRYLPPTAQDFAEADQEEGATALRPSSPEDLMRVLFRLPSTGAYAQVAAPMPTGLLARLEQSLDAVSAYREAQENRERVRTVFMASYVETALIVLMGAIWLGLAAASSISEPVARLVKAANQVAAGDLSVRVETDSQLEAIETLSGAFNRMTDDIKRQQADLLRASLDAENRRQFIETVLSGVSAGVLGLDTRGRISAINRQAARLLAVSEDHARGAALADVAPEFVDVVASAGEGAGAEAELDLLRGSDARRLRVRAGGDPRDGLVLTFDDITRLVTAQRNAAWKDVARRIAHEIKNPLTPIQLSAERLRRKYRKEITTDLETFDRCTDTIVRQVGDIGRMVDEFSAFARMPAPKFAACDAAEMLRASVFAQRVANPDIDIVLEEEAGASSPVVCDDRMIGQALTNVLKNAAEAIEARVQAEPGHRGRIVARVKDDGQHLVFEVEDNGVGLPAKDRARLAEPYVTTREKGTGLGLAIVKRIMEDHGGSLALRDSAAGQGAIVILSFPRGEASATPQPLVAEA